MHLSPIDFRQIGKGQIELGQTKLGQSKLGQIEFWNDSLRRNERRDGRTLPPGSVDAAR